MKYLSPDEIRGLKESGYDPVLLEARADSERWEAVNGLREKIESAFAGVTLGDGIGLMEGRGLDDYEDADVLAQLHAQDERIDWHRFSSETLLSYQSSISFTDAEGMRFHLPAWMFAELRDDGIAGLIGSLCRISPHNEQQFSLLSPEQRSVVRDFLEFMRDDPDYTHERAEIDAAIKHIWSQLPPQ
ncbi:hypothetical protein HAHE_26020 [Haloferula helveola]|nr:hypothetical protein HAHE_26020 [Haloferula helveola]